MRVIMIITAMFLWSTGVQAQTFDFFQSPIQPQTSRSVKYLPHPAGCPRRAFCGCGASIQAFGKSIRSLWLARAWFKFPSVMPAPRMAAVSGKHVFILDRHVKGKVWMAYDHNSGGHRSRYHARSIAGYKIVNPYGSKFASHGGSS